MIEALTLAGILIPAGLLAVAVRRSLEPIRWRTIGLFFVLVLLFLNGAVFSSKLPVPVDEVAVGYPYRGIFGPVTSKNPITNDTAKLFLPWMQVTREALFHLRAPLWNPYSFSGYPLLANGESAPFSPFFLATIFVPLPKQIVAMAGLELFTALLFSFLFARRWGASETGAMIAAIAFSFSGAMAVFLYYSTAAVMCLLPAAALAVSHCVREPARDKVVFLALVVAALQAAGHPESVVHVAMGCAAIVIIELIAGPERRGPHLHSFIALGGGSLLGAALSAPAWVPVLEQVRVSARWAEVHAGAGFGNLPARAAFGILDPNFFGSARRRDYAFWVNYSQFAFSYCGLLPLALAASTLFSRAARLADRLFIAASAVLFIVACGWTPVGAAIDRLPPFDFMANDKLRLVAIFLLAVVAGRAVDRAGRGFLYTALGVAICVGALILLRRPASHAVDLIGVAALGAAALLPRRFAPALLALELFVFFVPMNALVSGKYFRPRLPIIDALHAIAPREPFRIVGRDWVLLPNASAQYGVEDIRGSDPMELESYDRFLGTFTVQQSGTWVRRVVDVNRPELDTANVRYLIAEPDFQTDGKWVLRYRGADGTLFENRNVQPRFHAEGATVSELRSPSPGEFDMVVDAGSATVVSSSEPFTPDWSATANGAFLPLWRNGPFVEFGVPRGRTRVRIWYAPQTYWRSVAVAGIAAALMVLMFLRRSGGDTGRPVLDARPVSAVR